MAKADMHIHTTASDGVTTPADVVQLAIRAGLQAIAITDHDTIGGVREASDAGRRFGLEVVPGVEISTHLSGRDIHMLGYYVDIEDERFLRRLRDLRDVRKRRNEQIIGRLNNCGIAITMSDVWNTVDHDHGDDTAIARPHIAETLVSKGYAVSISDAFDRYLGEGGAAYVSPKRITPLEAVRWIREAGGAAVIAHPGLYGRDDIVEAIIASGVDGIEARHSDHTPEQERRYTALGERAGIVITAGSDYHGMRMGEMRHADIGFKTMDMLQLGRLKRSGN